MTNNNSKHVVANRSIAVSWKFVLLFRLIDVVFGESTVSSHIAATTIVIIFEDVFIFYQISFFTKGKWIMVASNNNGIHKLLNICQTTEDLSN